MTDRQHDHPKTPGGSSQSDSSSLDDTMFFSETSFAADLSAVQADDALLDALGGPNPDVAESLDDQELNALLLAWRRDIDSEPLPELVDTDSATAAVRSTLHRRRRTQPGGRRRMLVPVAAAAAVLAIAFAGTGLAARDAQPGDALWGLTKVFYAEHARSVEAAATVRTNLDVANVALAERRFDDARAALQQAETALQAVSTDDELTQLMATHQQLTAALESPSPSSQPDSSSQAPPSTQGPATPPPPTSLSQLDTSSPEASSSTKPSTSTTKPSESTSSSTSPTTSSSSNPGSGSESTWPDPEEGSSSP